MIYECHGHIILDGTDFRAAASRHEYGVDTEAVRRNLETLREFGITYFRDGGDNLGVSLFARGVAPEYGVEFVSPAFAIHREGRYGNIVGRGYRDISEYRALVTQAKEKNCDFIKIMLSGIMFFDSFGRMSCPPLEGGEIGELISIAHGEGFRVMAHVNGAEPIRAALEAGVDSIEHGYYMDGECISLLAETGAIWVPTMAAVNAFYGREGCNDAVIGQILTLQRENILQALETGAFVATGSDSGAAGVPHGEGLQREQEMLREAAGELYSRTEVANEKLRERFRV